MKNRLPELMAAAFVAISIGTPIRDISTGNYIISPGPEPLTYSIKGRDAYGAAEA